MRFRAPGVKLKTSGGRVLCRYLSGRANRRRLVLFRGFGIVVVVGVVAVVVVASPLPLPSGPLEPQAGGARWPPLACSPHSLARTRTIALELEIGGGGGGRNPNGERTRTMGAPMSRGAPLLSPFFSCYPAGPARNGRRVNWPAACLPLRLAKLQQAGRPSLPAPTRHCVH
jgi:hypothetical protein